MIYAADIIARLTEQCTDLAAVEDTARVEPIERDSADLPCASVHMVSDTPGFLALSGQGRQYRRRYEIRITAADDASLHTARAAIHHSLLEAWTVGEDAWAEYFGTSQPANYIRWVGGEMTAIQSGALQWRDLFDLQLCDYPPPSE
jgi:hypothetical protein